MARPACAPRRLPRPPTLRARPRPSQLTCADGSPRSTPAVQCAARSRSSWAAGRWFPFYSTPTPTTSTRRRRDKLQEVAVDRALIDYIAGITLLVDGDVREAALAVERAGAAGRRRVRCLHGHGRAPARGGGRRRRCGGARRSRARPWGRPCVFGRFVQSRMFACMACRYSAVTG